MSISEEVVSISEEVVSISEGRCLSEKVVSIS